MTMQWRVYDVLQCKCSLNIMIILTTRLTLMIMVIIEIIHSNNGSTRTSQYAIRNMSDIQNWMILFACSSYCLKGRTAPLGLKFLKTLCIFLKNKATLDKVSYGSGQKCLKELKNHSFPSVETIVVKLQ